jgi:hypothetical protein
VIVGLDTEIELGTAIVVLSIVVLAMLANLWHGRTHRKLDDIQGEAKGVRIRLERHAEESSDERKAMHEESKSGRAQIYQMFVEFLRYVKGK